MGSLLVVEDEDELRGKLRMLLLERGHQVEEARGVPDASELLRNRRYDLVLADLKLPPDKGTDLIAAPGGAPVMIMTSFGSIPSAVEAMQMGAVGYITKSRDHEELLTAVDRVLSRGARLGAEATARSPAMRDVLAQVAKIAPTPSDVLIRGETGSGKEILARAIHTTSARPGRFVTVDCSSIPETLIESELFGHEKGAFSGAVGARPGPFEEADGGTVFLDEIGDLPLSQQARLLRVLERREVRRIGSNRDQRVDVRVVSATHRNLEQMVEAGALRSDLYYRLRVCQIRLPPLRERAEDLEPLAHELLERARERAKRKKISFTAEALDAMREFSWPGNVRELQNAIESAVVQCEGSFIDRDLLQLDERIPLRTDPQPSNTVLSEKEYFCSTVLQLRERGYGETKIARIIGISRKALWDRCGRFGIPRPR